MININTPFYNLQESIPENMLLTDREVFEGISRSDSSAIQCFFSRFNALVFRFCRSAFRDHLRAAEFSETCLVTIVQEIRRGRLKNFDAYQVLKYVQTQLNTIKTGTGHNGLSSKQQALFDLFGELPLNHRLVADFILLCGYKAQDVARWLEISPETLAGTTETIIEKARAIVERHSPVPVHRHSTTHQRGSFHDSGKQRPQRRPSREEPYVPKKRRPDDQRPDRRETNERKISRKFPPRRHSQN